MSKKKNTKRTFHVRITEEWTDKNDTVYSVRFVQKGGEQLIRVQNLIKKGSHSSLLLGMSVNGLYQWQRNNLADTVPDSYNEIYDEEKKKWVRMLSRTELFDMHLFGDDDDTTVVCNMEGR